MQHTRWKLGEEEFFLVELGGPAGKNSGIRGLILLLVMLGGMALAETHEGGPGHDRRNGWH
jgi:hypothetical protein